MTRRQRLEAVINGEITEELIESCKIELAKIDAALSKGELSPSQVENREMGEAILRILDDGRKLRVDQLMKELGTDWKRQRVTSVCTELIRSGELKSEDVRTDKGKRKVYFKG